MEWVVKVPTPRNMIQTTIKCKRQYGIVIQMRGSNVIQSKDSCQSSRSPWSVAGADVSHNFSEVRLI